MKKIEIEGIGEVELRKSRRAKRLILKINQEGKPQVVMPAYAPYIAGEAFARKNQQWLKENISSQQNIFMGHGKPIAKQHTLLFKNGAVDAIKSRVGTREVVVSLPQHVTLDHPDAQAAAKKASIRALRRQAETYLPKLLHSLATHHGYSYAEVRIKAVRTRWGSCSSNRIINLSIWLMQLPDSLIEYVLCHELTHLNHMNHSKSFWQELESMIPDYKQRRLALREYKPTLQ